MHWLRLPFRQALARKARNCFCAGSFVATSLLSAQTQFSERVSENFSPFSASRLPLDKVTDPDSGGEWMEEVQLFQIGI
jgi:hypothetical protein